MGMLYENEIFDCMRDNMKSAIALCNEIATQPQSGKPYTKLVQNLKLCEGACIQAAHWREDTRWLQVGLKMEQCHQIARRWLDPISIGSKRMFSVMGRVLAENLRDLERLRNMAVGRSGLILPGMGAPISHVAPRNLAGVRANVLH